jgi:hypothetical protein
MHDQRPLNTRRPILALLAALFAVSLVLAACAPEEEPAAPEPDDPAEPDEPDDEEPAEPDVEPDEVDEAAFYFDKEVEIIVPFSAGGGTDAEARFMAPFLANHIPGAPTMGVFNIAGAGGTIGNNQCALERDHEQATSLLYSSASSFFPWIFQEQALQLDYRELVGLMVSQTGGIVYVRCDTGIETPEDFVAQAQDVEWVAGEQTVDSLGLLFLLAYDLIEMDYRVVMGFEGRGPARVAFEQGELNINWDTAPSVPGNVDPLIEEGVACPVFTVGQAPGEELEPDPTFSEDPYNLPTFDEIYEQIHGEPPSGEEWDAYIALTRSGFTNQKVMWLHQDSPQEAIDEMRAGFEAMTQDPEFEQQAPEVLGDYPIFVGDDVEPLVEALIDFPAEMQDWLIDYMVENYEHPDPRQ